MTRWFILTAALLLPGCAGPLAALGTPAGMAMIGAVAGAAADNAKLGELIVCAGMSAEGIKEDQTVSTMCGQQAKP